MDLTREGRGDLFTHTHGEIVRMGFDGWSNMHKPFLCVTKTTKNGDVYLVDNYDCHFG